MTTADCVAYIIEKVAPDFEVTHDGANDPLRVLIRKNIRRPGMWKRQAKYSVGSKTDRVGAPSDIGGGRNYAEMGKYDGGIVREFFLRDSDGICYALIEKDGAIVFMDDLCD